MPPPQLFDLILNLFQLECGCEEKTSIRVAAHALTLTLIFVLEMIGLSNQLRFDNKLITTKF
jgi:hypothetical protein